MGYRLSFLVGAEDYYGRFGYGPAAPLGIFMPGEKPQRLMVHELVHGALKGVSGDLAAVRA